MSLLETLQEKKVGNISLLQFIILMTAAFVILGVMLWMIQEAERPKPEIREGQADGIFQGKRYNWVADHPISAEAKARGCYNGSMLYFSSGTIVYSDGQVETVGEEGRKIEGLICKETVDSYIWQSSDKSSKTPITFSFVGVVSPMPVLDLSPYFPWFITAGSIGIALWAVYFRKLRRHRFDALSAIKIFKEYTREHGLAQFARGMPEAENAITEGSRNFVVSQDIWSKQGIYKLIMSISNYGEITLIRPDKTGIVYDTTLGREGRMMNMKMRQEAAKYSPTEAYDIGAQIAQELRDAKRKPETRPDQKAAEASRVHNTTEGQESQYAHSATKMREEQRKR